MPKRTSKAPLFIKIDTRETLPYTFDGCHSPGRTAIFVKSTLKEGDYLSERGCDDPDGCTIPENAAVVERKSLSDLYTTMGSHRERFEKELCRIKDRRYGYAAIVIEAELSAVMLPNEYLRHPTAMNPKSVVASLLAWSQRFGIHVFTCPGRATAERVTFRILERWIKDGQRLPK